MVGSHFYEIYVQDSNLLRMSGFFKTRYEATFSTIKIFLLKLGITKDENKENKKSINKSSSKTVFPSI